MINIIPTGVQLLYQLKGDSYESKLSYTTEKEFVLDEKLNKPQHEFIISELKQIGDP